MARKRATPLSLDAIEALGDSTFDGSWFKLNRENLACYGEIKALVTALGGRWVAKSGKHVFEDGVNAQQIIEAACSCGEIPATNPLDFYPTPEPVIKLLLGGEFEGRLEALTTCAEMDSRPMHFLEPNGGTGALAAVLYARLRPQDTLTIVEMNPISAALLRQRFPKATVIEGDFLDYVADREFDVILMNPPFNGKEYQKHIRLAFSMLRRLGILSAVAPRGFVDDANVDFLFFINVRGTFEQIEGTPFKGVSIPTCVLQLENDPSQRDWREKAHEGFSTWHAFSANMAISSDRLVLEKLERCETFGDALAVLESWNHEINRSGSASRMDEGIAREVIKSLCDSEMLQVEFEAVSAFYDESPAATVASDRIPTGEQSELVLT